MDAELFFTKVYTVAYRLTGDSDISKEITMTAIDNGTKGFDQTCKITEEMTKNTILELIKVFLVTPLKKDMGNHKGIQKALLRLEPVDRAVIIWRDVLGYKIYDNVPIINYTKQELKNILSDGRYKLLNTVKAGKNNFIDAAVDSEVF